MAERRKMMGFPSATIDGKMFAGLFNDKMILRLSESDAAMMPGAKPFEPMPGRAMTGWVVAPMAILNDTRELNAWMEKAVRFTKSVKKKQPDAIHTGNKSLGKQRGYVILFASLVAVHILSACSPTPSPTVPPATATSSPSPNPQPTFTATLFTPTRQPTLPPPTATSTTTPRPITTQIINALLEPIRLKNKLPGIGGAIVTSKGMFALGATGVRKAGTNVPVTIEDLWHLGSDTKAMTAMIAGDLIDHGKLRLDSTLQEVFPDLSAGMNADYRQVTLLQLLSHRAGFPHDLNWDGISKSGNLREQRESSVKIATQTPPLSPPGSKYEYSNVSYVVIGAMEERVTNDSWENLMTRTIFDPLGMSSAGFGGTGTPGQIDQPWPHNADGSPTPTNGPKVDNPPVMGPAGTVHTSLADWSNFVADQLRGLRGESSLLKSDTYLKLHSPPFGGNYAAGWDVAQRDWAGGTVYDHAGSNNLNFASVWVAPKRDLALLVVTNQGGESAAKASDDAVAALVQLYGTR